MSGSCVAARHRNRVAVADGHLWPTPPGTPPGTSVNPRLFRGINALSGHYPFAKNAGCATPLPRSWRTRLRAFGRDLFGLRRLDAAFFLSTGRRLTQGKRRPCRLQLTQRKKAASSRRSPKGRPRTLRPTIRDGQSFFYAGKLDWIRPDRPCVGRANDSALQPPM